MCGRPLPPTVVAGHERRRHADRTARDDRDRGWAGRPRDRLPPGPQGSVARDPRRERARGRLVAQALAVPSALHARRVRRAARDAVPGAAVLVPDRNGDGGLPRVVCGALRPPGAKRRRRRRSRAERRGLRGHGGHASLRGGQRRRRDGRHAAREPGGPGVRRRARPLDQGPPLRRLPQSRAAAGRRGARGRRLALGGRHRLRGREGRLPDDAVGAGQGPASLSTSRAAACAWRCRCCASWRPAC